MEVKPGYKQTEVGVIPEEWDVKQLGQIAQLKNGYAFKSETYDPLGDFRIITIANVQDGFMDAAECSRIISPPSDLQAHQRLRLGDILISMTGNVGRVCRVTEPSCLLNQRVGKLMPTGFDANLLFLILGQRRFISSMATKAKGGAQGNLSVTDITEFQFAVPRTEPEQRAIAEALSDVDGLLGGLDRLIAKKRDLKQAAMQQLLTGQTRLPGFHGEWKPWTVLQVAPHIIDYRGRTPLKLGMEWGGGEIPALSARNVKMGYIDFHEETNFGSDALYRRWMTNGHTRKEDLVVTTEAPLGNVALIPDDRKYILSQRTILLQVDPTIASSRFLFQLMMGSRFQQALAENSSGSTATGIQRKQFEKLELTLPKVPEQTAIAEVLTEMDQELAGLEQRREKTRALKQAMMQELLTGKTRLV